LPAETDGGAILLGAQLNDGQHFDNSLATNVNNAHGRYCILLLRRDRNEPLHSSVVGYAIEEMISMSVFAHLYIAEAGRLARSVAVRGTTTIGLDDDNDIVLESITFSRLHAILVCDSAGVRLIDLESTNGAFVNGALVPPDEPVRLADGDLIRLGQAVLRFAAQPAGSRSLRRRRMATDYSVSHND
jgi:hypothetical protein